MSKDVSSVSKASLILRLFTGTVGSIVVWCRDVIIINVHSCTIPLNH